MTRSTLAVVLWCVLGFIVFNVRFDWRTRQVAHDFALEQLVNYQQNRPRVTINDGYRPRMQAEARRAAAWAGLIVVAGVGGTAWAGRRDAES
jgi:hypothetical protein